MGGRGLGVGTNEVEFSAVQEFPLDLFAWLQADGGRQGQGEAHIEPRVLATGADDLDAQGIGDGGGAV